MKKDFIKTGLAILLGLFALNTIMYLINTLL